MEKKVRICMVGAGRVGKLHSGTIKRFVPQAEVVSLVDPNPSVLEETGVAFGIDGRFHRAGGGA